MFGWKNIVRKIWAAQELEINVEIDEQNWLEEVTVDFTNVGISKSVPKPQKYNIELNVDGRTSITPQINHSTTTVHWGVV